MQQVLIGGRNQEIGFFPAYNLISGGSAWKGVENQIRQCIPTTGELSNLYVRLSGNVGAEATLTFTIYVNGNPSALTVTIEAGLSTGSDLVHALSLSAGQVVSLEVSSTGVPGALRAAWCTLWTGSIPGESICLTRMKSSGTVTRYTSVQGHDDDATPTESSCSNPLPTAGTFSKLYVNLSTAPGVGKQYTFRFRAAAEDSDLIVIIADNDTAGNDTTNSSVVAPGELISVSTAPTGTPSVGYCAVGLVFTSDIADESLILGWNANTLPNGAVNYQTLGAVWAIWDETEANAYSLLQAVTLKKFYVALDGIPGTDNSYVFNVRINGANAGTPATLSVTIADDATSGNDTTNTALGLDGQTCGIEETPVSIPVTRHFKFGLVGSIEEAAVGLENKSANMGSKMVAAGLI